MKIIVKGEEKICQKTVKEEVTCMQEELVSILEDSVVKFLMHVRNINHQQTTMNGIKKTLTSNDVLIHADFSENYVCKYGREVQSSHFGGSKQQITLHTVVVYHLSPDTLELKVTSYCSLSDSLRHDPSAICAHLKPIIMEIKRSQPSLKTAHIFTDSPVTQYRNRKMFYLIATFLAPELGVDALNWHYTESGHGKGAPDGVGGCLKRIANSLVGRGKDMNNFNRLTDELAANSKKINVIKIAAQSIESVDKLLPKKLKAFKGTMCIHQVTWTKKYQFLLQARHLSCLLCSPGEACSHYGIGVIKLPINYSRNIKHNKKTKLGYSNPYSFSDDYFGSDTETSKLEIPTKLNPNTFIVVKFATKKSFKHFVALVLSCENSDEYIVKFMKKCMTNKFVFPKVDDIAEVNAVDIVGVLSQPIMNKREQYLFNEHLDKFDNLC
ncbi:hypothetical protein AVEN_195401-1 [Araneus ventricosus]|uniref:Uncharacterized protein n=1 Tax=Araneus ventricosus TaxID=182803 RepID=A0A4Y2V6L2_ARAVE|nr:hypothetical protein AVEN_195401-1 [Araneus ventricosus]